jgi:MYXO-CTERM domain-containing protein
MRRAIWVGVTLGVLLATATNATAGAPLGTIVINEIDYDQESTDTAEFIELKNVSGAEIADLSIYEVVMVNGANETIYRTVALPAVSLANGDYFVICSNAATVANCDLDESPDTNFIQNGAPDAVAVQLAGGGAIQDTVSYDGDTVGYTEGSGDGLVDDPTRTQSISRFPDGVDTGANNVDLSPRCSTPGETNSADTVCPECGVGGVETGEQCDDGAANGTIDSCCDINCQFNPVDTACGDQTDDDCANPGTCDASGTCLSNDESDGTTCTDDGNECTADQCTTGVCTHPDLTAGAACGDGTDDDCANPDTCDGAGACLSNDEADGTSCTDDGNDCTADACTSGVCEHPALSVGTACGDGTDSDCLNPDTCDGAGACQSNDESDGTACTSDGNDCTGDVCGSGVCTHPNETAGTSCGDGTDDDCRNPDTCDGSGSCLANDESDGTSCTDDGNECTDDVCASAACDHPALSAGTSCGDDSDDDCRNPDTCDGAGACQSNDESDGTACTDDGVECTSDLCQSGACEHAALADGETCTDDGNECTDDVCASGACTHPNAADGTACTADGNECTDDVCATGACSHPSSSAGTACGDTANTDCSDPDTCNGSGACQPNHAPDGTACTDNGAFCDGDEACGGGACDSAGNPCDPDNETCDDTADECVRPPCGDGVVEGAEECDDFNFEAGDGCTDCTVDAGWACGDDDPGDGVSDCYETCGNSTLDDHEDCEDGDAANGDGCSDTCRVEDGWECVEGAGGLDECSPVCGDGIRLTGETCDDANADSGDGCSSACTVEDGWLCDNQQPSVCARSERDDGGCGCATGAGETGAPWSLLLLGLGLLALRRRRV